MDSMAERWVRHTDVELVPQLPTPDGGPPAYSSFGSTGKPCAERIALI